jgi:hypothetical protein
MLRAVCLLVIAVLRGWHCTQGQAEREAHCADIYNSMQYINVNTPIGRVSNLVTGSPLTVALSR